MGEHSHFSTYLTFCLCVCKHISFSFSVSGTGDRIMGLDKALFDDVPDECICVLCRNVFLDPIVLPCKHMFCNACFMRRFKMDKPTVCPTCHSSIEEEPQTSNQEFKLKLLNLTITCTHKCDRKITLGELPEHVSEDCPLAPVSCPNESKGCKKKVRRRDLNKHIAECNFRSVTCEACGHKTIFQDLFTHQSRTRCLERKLKQQVIRELRQAHHQVVNHRSNVTREHIRRDIQQAKTIVEHARYLQDRKQKLHQLLLSPTNSTIIINDHQDSFFLTDLEDLRSKEKSLTTTPYQSRSALCPVQCERCLKLFVAEKNHQSACQWHSGVSTLN